MKDPGLSARNSPFDHEQADLLNRLLSTLTPDQAVWLSGFLAGLHTSQPQPLPPVTASPPPVNEPVPPPAQTPATKPEVTVLFGSQTGNAMQLAGELAGRIEKFGLKASLSCMSEYRANDLKKATHLLLVTSTHGDGDPPDKAMAFYDFLHSRRAPRLEGMSFSVLALGDTTYPKFCQTGKNFDKRLEELGAKRLYPRADCDIDYRPDAEAWMKDVLQALGAKGADAVAEGAKATAGIRLPLVAPRPLPSAPRHSRENPFRAEVIDNFPLNGRGSDKETRYLKFSLEGSGLTFEPGDSLGIVPENHPQLVDELIGHMGWPAEERVTVGNGEVPLRDALLKHYEISSLTRPMLEQAANISRDGLRKLVCEGRSEGIRTYMEGRDLLDLVRDFSFSGVPARDFVGILRKLPPRLYSISSSQKANPDEVDVTIVAVRYCAHDRQRCGTCSVHCAERVATGDRLPIYIHRNPTFRMPADPNTPLIMIGAGTGVAPYRAFLEDREERGAQGRTWLFFGDRRFRTDFLYQLEWLRWRKRSVLTRMDVAFSRDQDRKVYVQHRMLERSRELYAWLEEGACVYVCGDRKRLAPDVHAALETILQQEGHLSADNARNYLSDLHRQNRYQRDVY